MDFSPRALVAGRYRVERPLGAGAMGEVWAAVHTSIGVRVALKRLSPAGAASHEMIARFKREAQLLGRARSDHVARVLDFVEDDAYGHVLVMELVEGQSLMEVIARRPLELQEAVSLGCDVLRGLVDLHAVQIIHRDLKPGNVIVERRRSGERAVIVDFGMSRVMDQGGDDELTGITRAGVALGTLSYMAPEQILNSRGVTGAADLYAMGAILFRSLAGRHAYTDDDESALARRKLTEDAPPLPLAENADPIARGLAAVVARALRRKPSERFASAEDMLTALERLRERAMFIEDDTTNQPEPTRQRPLVAPPSASPLPVASSVGPDSQPSLDPMQRGVDASASQHGASLPGAPRRSPALGMLVVGVAVGALLTGAILTLRSRPTGDAASRFELQAPGSPTPAASLTAPSHAGASTRPAGAPGDALPTLAAPGTPAPSASVDVVLSPSALPAAAHRAAAPSPLPKVKPTTTTAAGEDGF